jgi:tetratricopeptide (TPR) repeat protein
MALMGDPATLDVSVVVVVYNIPREAERTLYSLSAAYQQHIGADAYEIIVVDNGSEPPFDPGVFEGLDGHFRLIRIDDAPPSPARAVNVGLAAARGGVIGVMIDGARLVTPGLLHFARHGVRLYERAVVATLGWHLGFDTNQRLAMDAGYDKAREDGLLASIDWPNDGYRLFEISALDGSSINGWLSLNGESNALFLSRAMWDLLGGVDERFDAPGGGLVNLDVFRRAVETPKARLVVLLGEASFHQTHGGIATNAAVDAFPAMFERWRRQYEQIRKQPWVTPVSRAPRTLLGHLPRAALAHFLQAATTPVPSILGSTEPPLGPSFDGTPWSVTGRDRPADPVVAKLADLAEAEFRAGRYAAAAAVGRLARAYAPDERAPQRLLAHVSQWSSGLALSAAEVVATHMARAEAYRLMGRFDDAAAEYRAALALDPDLRDACLGLARLRMPGGDYYTWLERLHRTLRPQHYVEIGVDQGATLRLAAPPTRAFGVDPEPTVAFPLRAETHVFAEPSDTFFAERRLDAWLSGRPVAMAFIDGLHHFEQCLKDVMHLEPYCAPTSVVLIHDTVPLDETTQRRKRQTFFWTGDVWKAILALRRYRPDLDIFTIATPPTGLTVVTGLDPSSRVLAEVYDEAVATFIDTDFAAVEARLPDVLGVVPNDWPSVAERLRKSGVL